MTLSHLKSGKPPAPPHKFSHQSSTIPFSSGTNNPESKPKMTKMKMGQNWVLFPKKWMVNQLVIIYLLLKGVLQTPLFSSTNQWEFGTSTWLILVD
jgi:hypothetical protein